MNVTTTKTTVQCHLASGETATLTVADCAAIINALARRRLLTVLVDAIPAEYSEVMTEECCAWEIDGDDDRDEEVVLSVNASDFISATPRKPVAKKKAAKRKSR